MDATIKADDRELVIRLANGSSVHMPLNGRGKHIVTAYAPGGRVLGSYDVRTQPLATHRAVQCAILLKELD